jgi:hypothetical protein
MNRCCSRGSPSGSLANGLKALVMPAGWPEDQKDPPHSVSVLLEDWVLRITGAQPSRSGRTALDQAEQTHRGRITYCWEPQNEIPHDQCGPIGGMTLT